MQSFDVIIIGAGAAGLMCAREAGKRGKRVLVLDHAKKPAEKVRISGGGRCNFTNLHASLKQFISQNPAFCASALARYTQHDFIALVEQHGIHYHEKTLGQLFCDDSSQRIIDMLLSECADAAVRVQLSTSVTSVSKQQGVFSIHTQQGDVAHTYDAPSLVVATGGLSIPKMGASDFGYRLAKQFGHAIVPTHAALVPFTLAEEDLAQFAPLSGVAVDAEAAIGAQRFREGLLFTHRGLSGPAALQISSYWNQAQAVGINLCPDHAMPQFLKQAKHDTPKQELATVLSRVLPKRVAHAFLARYLPEMATRRLTGIADKTLLALGGMLNHWPLVPHGTEGYRTAEVTRGGVDTSMLSSKTMESTCEKGLYFIGEVVDVTGHLGGYNFQWAWSSGVVAGQHV